MGNFTIWIMALTVIATVVIAVYAGLSHKLNSKINVKDEEYRQQISDLLQAMVLSNLMSTDSGLEGRLKKFSQTYNGKTTITIPL